MNLQTKESVRCILFLPMLLGLWLCAFRLLAAEPGTTILAINGAVDHPLHLQLAEWKGLPRMTTRVNDGEGAEATFEGVSLWDVIQEAKPKLDPKSHKDLVNSYLVAKARDGYQVMFSLAEIAPLLTDRKIILADRRHGETLPEAQGPLRIIVPGERMRARWVRQVSTLEIVSLLAKGNK